MASLLVLSPFRASVYAELLRAFPKASPASLPPSPKLLVKVSSSPSRPVVKEESLKLSPASFVTDLMLSIRSSFFCLTPSIAPCTRFLPSSIVVLAGECISNSV